VVSVLNSLLLLLLSTWWLAAIWTIFMLKKWFKITSSEGKIRQRIDKSREKLFIKKILAS